MLQRMPTIPAALGAAVLLLSANSAMADGNLKVSVLSDHLDFG
jgi:hypothetical protein